jgi:DUF1680 family protein
MPQDIPRRDFLKAAPPAASILAMGTAMPDTLLPDEPYPTIGSARYSPTDYPIAPKRFTDVTLTDTFWKPKIATNAEVTIPYEAARSDMPGDGLSGNVLEAAIYSLETHADPVLQDHVEARIQELAESAGERRRPSNEFFEVAVAWHRSTRKRTLLDPAIGVADALYEDFEVRRPPFSGGERDAINCLQLYRTTGEKRHLDLAKHYLDIRGLPSSLNRSRHNQSYKPVWEQSEAVGHAVNCVTLMVSLADVGMLTGLHAYFDAAHRMWTDAATRKMYITGGVGSTGNEGFGEPYVLPNVSAYSETCAVLMWMTLNHRLFLATGDAKYIDILERGMYNNALSGVSQTGNRFFYVNRLESAGDGRDARWARASLECCPPNLVRFLASMPGYIYAQDKHGAVYVNLYASSKATFDIGGDALALAVESEMPWAGKSTIEVASATPINAKLKLRVPGWARNQPVPGALYRYADGSSGRMSLRINGTTAAAAPDRLGYVTLDRVWKAGDTVELTLPVETRRVAADDRVIAARGRVAVERGPIVYCAEWPDCDAGKALDVLLDPHATLSASMGRVGDTQAILIDTMARSLSNPAAAGRQIRLIPYHLWANRGVGQMTVWLAAREYQVGDIGPAGGLIFHVNPTYQSDGWRYLEAAPFDQSAGAKWGCFRTPIRGATATAVGAGRHNTLDMLAECNDPESAAALCAKASINGFTDWFLPSRDELALMYARLVATNAADFGQHRVADNDSYWSSTQATTDMAHHIDFADAGRQHYDDKDFPRRVRAVRAF